MNKNNDSVELSYYQLTLLSFLKESHPELVNDSDLIVSRANLAVQTYSQTIENGQTHIQAEESANEVLFEGLHFSKYDTLVNVLWNEFAQEVPQGSAKELAQQLLSVCEGVFTNYPLSDDFAYKPQFEQLYTELTGAIVIWLEDHELQ